MTGHHQSQSAPRGVERAIVLQLLREDHADGWSRSELEAEFRDVASPVLSKAIKFLEGERVLVIHGEQTPHEQLVASLCAKCLSELGLVSV
jgi:hypothetical protein